MALGATDLHWKTRRHQATRAEILDAAWHVAREKGLAGMSLAEIAAIMGMRVPSLYSYFASKAEIYDAMFAQGNEEFLDFARRRLAELPQSPRARLRGSLWIYFDFCTADPARYQLLFQRPIPGFEPSPASYAKALEVIREFREDPFLAGLVRSQRDQDFLTALSAGLVDQQLSNDPGGQRWASLVDEVAEMAYQHLMKKPKSHDTSPDARKGEHHEDCR